VRPPLALTDTATGGLALVVRGEVVHLAGVDGSCHAQRITARSARSFIARREPTLNAPATHLAPVIMRVSDTPHARREDATHHVPQW
jgi:hypothetical protein